MRKKWIALLMAGIMSVSLSVPSVIMAEESASYESETEDNTSKLPELPEGVVPVTWDVSPEKLMIQTDEAREFYTKIKANEYPSIEELKESNVVHQLDALRDYYMAKYGKTIEIDTPEREQLRQDILDQFLALGSARTDSISENGRHHYVYDGPLKKDFQMELALGLSASGKSTLIADPDSEDMGAFILDADVIKGMLPEYQESHGAAADCVHMEGMEIMQRAISAFTVGDMKGTNVILPIVSTSLDDLFNNYIKPFEDAGYNVKAKLREAIPNESMSRVFARTLEGGQLIGSGVVFAITTEPEEVYYELAPMINAKGETYGYDLEEALDLAA